MATRVISTIARNGKQDVSRVDVDGHTRVSLATQDTVCIETTMTGTGNGMVTFDVSRREDMVYVMLSAGSEPLSDRVRVLVNGHYHSIRELGALDAAVRFAARTILGRS